MTEASANASEKAPVKAEEAPVKEAEKQGEVDKQKTGVTEAAPPRPVKIEESPDATTVSGGRSLGFYAVVGITVAAVAGAAAYFIIKRDK